MKHSSHNHDKHRDRMPDEANKNAPARDSRASSGGERMEPRLGAGNILRARDVMVRGVRSVAPDTPISELAEIFNDEGMSGLPVIDRKSRLVGIVTKTDIARALAEAGVDSMSRAIQPMIGIDEEDDVDVVSNLNGKADLTLTARALMSTGVVTAGEDETAAELAARMLEHGIHRVIIVKGVDVVGIVSSFDLLRAIVDYESILANQ
jgi:CBS domain-containing protein